jgi:hypothetical protein
VLQLPRVPHKFATQRIDPMPLMSDEFRLEGGGDHIQLTARDGWRHGVDIVLGRRKS